MQDKPRVIRLLADGPDGLGLIQLDLDPVDFQSALPIQHGHVFYEDAEIGLVVGVWDTTTMQEAFGPYPGDEFIFVLDGQFSMMDAYGAGIPAAAGECVAFRNGAPMSWKQDGYLKKFYVTLLDPNAPTPSIDTADEAVVVLGASTQLEMSPKSGTTSEMEAVAFTNDAGTMRAGLWECQAADLGWDVYPVHEFVRVLDGEVIITEVDGTQHRFEADDCFFIPQGTEIRREIPKFTKTCFARISVGSHDT